MGSRMPNLPLILRTDTTLHPFWQTNIKQSRIPTSQQVLKNKMDVFEKIQRAKLQQCQNLSIPMLVFHLLLKNNKNRGIGKKWGFHHASLFLTLYLSPRSKVYFPCMSPCAANMWTSVSAPDSSAPVDSKNYLDYQALDATAISIIYCRHLSRIVLQPWYNQSNIAYIY